MSDNIFGTRFLGNRAPAWHGLGRVFTEPMLPSEAVAEIADYPVEKVAIPSVQTRWGSVQPERFLIVRGPTHDDPQPQILGYAGEDYEVLQNSQIAKMLDPLAESGMPLETVGVLGKGERWFLTLACGDYTIGRDEIRDFLLVTEGKNGGIALTAAITPVRTVCQNTLVSGLASATMKLAVPHKTGVAVTGASTIHTIARARAASTALRGQFEAMAKMSLVEEQVEAILAAAFPLPKASQRLSFKDALGDTVELVLSEEEIAQYATDRGSHDYAMGRTLVVRAGARELLTRFNDEFPEVANTSWAVYNAVVECSDYRNGAKSTAESAIFGARAGEKARAFQAAAKLSS